MGKRKLVELDEEFVRRIFLIQEKVEADVGVKLSFRVICSVLTAFGPIVFPTRPKLRR